MSRHTTTGNDRPWEVARGYQYAMRNPAPIQSDLPSMANVIARLIGGALVVLAGFAIIAATVEVLK